MKPQQLPLFTETYTVPEVTDLQAQIKRLEAANLELSQANKALRLEIERLKGQA